MIQESLRKQLEEKEGIQMELEKEIVTLEKIAERKHQAKL